MDLKEDDLKAAAAEHFDETAKAEKAAAVAAVKSKLRQLTSTAKVHEQHAAALQKAAEAELERLAKVQVRIDTIKAGDASALVDPKPEAGDLHQFAVPPGFFDFGVMERQMLSRLHRRSY